MWAYICELVARIDEILSSLDTVHNRMSHLEEMMGNLVDRLPDRSQHRIMPDIITPTAFTTSPGLSEPTSTNQDPLTCGLVTFPEAETLCQTYQKMSHQHFPCVIVPERLGVLELQQERPMLLQAMLVVASWQNKPRQIALEKFYVKELGLRFFNGERSLDILQGLLVYLAWYVIIPFLKKLFAIGLIAQVSFQRGRVWAIPCISISFIVCDNDCRSWTEQETSTRNNTARSDSQFSASSGIYDNSST